MHPQDALRDASFDRSGQAAAASRDAGEAGRVEADVREAQDNHSLDLLRRGLTGEIELQALLDLTRKERGAGAARHRPVEAFVAVRAWLSAKQQGRLARLPQQVVALVLRNAD